MTQTEIDFKGRKLPDNPFTKGTGNWRVYDHLQEWGEVTLHDLHHILHVDTARIRCDVKTFLRSHDFDIDWKPIKQGKTLYWIVDRKQRKEEEQHIYPDVVHSIF